MDVNSEPLEEQWPARESQIKQLSVLLYVSELTVIRPTFRSPILTRSSLRYLHRPRS